MPTGRKTPTQLNSPPPPPCMVHLMFSLHRPYSVAISRQNVFVRTVSGFVWVMPFEFLICAMLFPVCTVIFLFLLHAGVYFDWIIFRTFSLSVTLRSDIAFSDDKCDSNSTTDCITSDSHHLCLVVIFIHITLCGGGTRYLAASHRSARLSWAQSACHKTVFAT